MFSDSSVLDHRSAVFEFFFLVLTGTSEAMDSMEYAKEVLVLHYNNPASFFSFFLNGFLV